MIITYPVHQLVEYINWIYFFHAWGFQPRYAALANVHNCPACLNAWSNDFSTQEERNKAAEAQRLYKDALTMLRFLDDKYSVKTLVAVLPANASGDDVLVYKEDGTTVLLPFLRQQTPSASGAPFYCLSDWIMPLSLGKKDKIGVFAATVEEAMEHCFDEDEYKRFIVRVLCERLAEAAVEKTHLRVRTSIWGYAKGERLSIQDLLMEKFQGIRPAVGYPSMPDQSLAFVLDDILGGMSQIGISLTESGMMRPTASVCGLMLSHPQARYFSVGIIGEDQLEDYAARRGQPVEVMRKFLARNMK